MSPISLWSRRWLTPTNSTTPRRRVTPQIDRQPDRLLSKLLWVLSSVLL